MIVLTAAAFCKATLKQFMPSLSRGWKILYWYLLQLG